MARPVPWGSSMDRRDPAYEPRSLWTATTEPRRFPRLDRDVEVDVAIVGAGIAGLSCAIMLARAGRRVAVLDDGPYGRGATAATTAHLANAIDDRYLEIERLHGPDGARLAAASHTQAIDRIEEIVRSEVIDCGFERLDGYLFRPRGDERVDLEQELEAARRAGLADVEVVRRAPLDSYDTGPCLRFPRHGQLHPLRYLAGISAALERSGALLFGDTHVDRVEGGDAPRAVAGEHAVRAAAIIVATNTPLDPILAIDTKQVPSMTYVIGARVPRGAVTPALYWDTDEPYHYLRLHRLESGNGRPPEDCRLVGGEDHDTVQAEDTTDRHARLEAWARARVPAMRAVEYRWSGPVMETFDGLGLIGADPTGERNVYLVTGDSGMGMTHGTIAGILLTELLAGRDHPWARLYDPSRTTLRANGTSLREAATTLVPLGDAFAAGEAPGEERIPRDRGAVLRHGSRRVAVYRDADGGVHAHSAVCPHLGCIVGWNDAAKTWDCPCHGSRFDRFGGVVHGPAGSDLEPVDLRAPERA